MISQAEFDAAQGLFDFINASPTPYHAAANAARRLEQHGFTQLDERATWTLAPGQRHYVRRGGTFVGFECAERAPSSTGFLLLGAHTDSPNLRVKPQPDLDTQGYRQLGVEVYGGVLFSTWLDRDLSIAGRVRLRDGVTELVDFKEPVCRIPNLAIHLERSVNIEVSYL